MQPPCSIPPCSSRISNSSCGALRSPDKMARNNSASKAGSRVTPSNSGSSSLSDKVSTINCIDFLSMCSNEVPGLFVEKIGKPKKLRGTNS